MVSRLTRADLPLDEGIGTVRARSAIVPRVSQPRDGVQVRAPKSTLPVSWEEAELAGISTEVYNEVVIAGAGLPGATQVAQADWIEVRPVYYFASPPKPGHKGTR